MATVHNTVTDKFFYLLQVASGRQLNDEIEIAAHEWEVIYEMACKQSLAGFIFKSLEELSKYGQKPPVNLLFEWIGLREQIKQQNEILDQQCAQLSRWFSVRNYMSCILKGQGVAKLYPEPDSRQPGDIDIWVNGKREVIVKELKNNHIGVNQVDYVDSHVSFFTATEVEVHFRPTWMFNPFVNIKVQRWIRQNKDTQMSNYDKELEFCYPTIGFNLVFSLIHIYRHVFFEGIGLRQLTDYYYILTHSTEGARGEAYKTLQSFGLQKFVATVMYIMRRVFNIDEKLLLCTPNMTEGEFLLSEILRGGNFGHFDDRITRISDEHRWRKGLENAKRNLRFLIHYPNEVIWIPGWKLWHWCWRKCNGYL